MHIEWERSTFDPVNFAGRDYIIKRDDLLLPIGGNKARKLYHLSRQDLSAVTGLISYGGAQSNAMLALSQFCKINSLSFDYYTRPVPNWLKQTPLGNLATALHQGMQWHISDSGLPPNTLNDNQLLIPQGISMPEAELGIKRLASEIQVFCSSEGIINAAIVLPSGTGATALYLQQHLEHTVYTVPCIGDALILTQFFKQRLPDATRYPIILETKQSKAFRFGEPHPKLLAIYRALLESTGIEFELLYDAKTWLAMSHWDCELPTIYIHNGGTSGNVSMLARYRRLGLIFPIPSPSIQGCR